MDCSFVSIDRRQVKQLLYGSTRRQRQGADVDLSAAALEQEQESALLSELADGDFSADQNVVEVCDTTTLLIPKCCATDRRTCHLATDGKSRCHQPKLVFLGSVVYIVINDCG